MLTTIHEDTWNVLNMQHITQIRKRWDYSDIPGGGHKKIIEPAQNMSSRAFVFSLQNEQVVDQLNCFITILKYWFSARIIFKGCFCKIQSHIVLFHLKRDMDETADDQIHQGPVSI